VHNTSTQEVEEGGKTPKGSSSVVAAVASDPRGSCFDFVRYVFHGP
jgi:hypothetical protein